MFISGKERKYERFTQKILERHAVEPCSCFFDIWSAERYGNCDGTGSGADSE